MQFLPTEYLKSFAMKEKKFPVAFIYNSPNVIINESSNIVDICVKIALAPCSIVSIRLGLV